MSIDGKAPDFGPDIRQTKERGRIAGWVKDKRGNPVLDRKGRRKPLVVTLREPEVVREDRPDPQNPNVTVRGARRRDSVATMWRKQQLTDAQLVAAERYRDELAVASGARFSLPGDKVTTRLRHRNFEPTVAQVDAITSCKAAWKAVGPIHQPVLSWVVVSWGTLEGYAECKHMRRERARNLLVAALDRLADFYTAARPFGRRIAAQPAPHVGETAKPGVSRPVAGRQSTGARIMTDEKPSNETTKPAGTTDKDGFTKVDTGAQEEAAKVREESGGYD